MSGKTEVRIKDMNEFKELMDVLVDRKTNPVENSYTAYLYEKGTEKILKKLGEECTETVIAAMSDDRQEIILESSDLIYHLFVLLAHKNISLEEIEAELAKRSQKTGNKKAERKPVENY